MIIFAKKFVLCFYSVVLTFYFSSFILERYPTLCTLKTLDVLLGHSTYRDLSGNAGWTEIPSPDNGNLSGLRIFRHSHISVSVSLSSLSLSLSGAILPHNTPESERARITTKNHTNHFTNFNSFIFSSINFHPFQTQNPNPLFVNVNAFPPNFQFFYMISN